MTHPYILCTLELNGRQVVESVTAHHQTNGDDRRTANDAHTSHPHFSYERFFKQQRLIRALRLSPRKKNVAFLTRMQFLLADVF